MVGNHITLARNPRVQKRSQTGEDPDRDPTKVDINTPPSSETTILHTADNHNVTHRLGPHTLTNCPSHFGGRRGCPLLHPTRQPAMRIYRCHGAACHASLVCAPSSLEQDEVASLARTTWKLRPSHQSSSHTALSSACTANLGRRGGCCVPTGEQHHPTQPRPIQGGLACRVRGRCRVWTVHMTAQSAETGGFAARLERPRLCCGRTNLMSHSLCHLSPSHKIQFGSSSVGSIAADSQKPHPLLSPGDGPITHRGTA